MSSESFKKKYNQINKSGFNKAIREEMWGGDELLDLMIIVSRIGQHSTGREREKLDDIATGLHQIRNAMVEGIKENYGLSKGEK